LDDSALPRATGQVTKPDTLSTVVADSRSPRDGRFIEIVGRYNPQTDPSTIDLDEAKIKDWMAKGAQPTEPVSRLIRAAGFSG